MRSKLDSQQLFTKVNIAIGLIWHLFLSMPSYRDTDMSALESLIWTVLGYLAMPTIFVIGFAAVAAVALFLLKMLGAKSIQPDVQQQDN